MDWLRRVRPGVQARLRPVRCAVFDFDGTISTLRRGWEEIMAVFMVAEITAGQLPAPEVETEVRRYIDHSAGIQTIRQMEWLAQTTARRGLNPRVLTGREYKKLYNDRLIECVNKRLACLESGSETASDHSVRGAREFIALLSARGVRLSLASGSDHASVVHEAGVLGVLDYFEGRVFGALDGSDAHAKDRVLDRILAEGCPPDELLVVGDGGTEIREAAARGALALGVASNERDGGWDPQKIVRLAQAGADLLVADFVHAEELIDIFCPVS